MKLPKGYEIVSHSRTGIRFVRTPDGKLIPNQGTRKPIGTDHPDELIISDFYIWYNRQGFNNG